MVKIQVNSQGKAYYTSAGKVLVAPEGGSSGKYSLLERISDDSNNEIGTVSGFFIDANGDRYAVVCLDAVNRLASGAWCSDTSTVVTNLPVYGSSTWELWEAKETATYNTQKILDYCSAGGYTSTACSHCRSKSFIIDGTTYYGQLPNMIELNDIMRNYTAIDTADSTAGSYSSVDFSEGRVCWSSSQFASGSAWCTGFPGAITYAIKTATILVIPVLEIPIPKS